MFKEWMVLANLQQQKAVIVIFYAKSASSHPRTGPSKVSGAWFLCGWTGNTIESPLHASLLLSSHCVVVIFKGHIHRHGNRKGASLFCSTLKEFMKRYISTNYGFLAPEIMFFPLWKESSLKPFLQGVLVKVEPYRNLHSQFRWMRVFLWLLHYFSLFWCLGSSNQHLLFL